MPTLTRESWLVLVGTAYTASLSHPRRGTGSVNCRSNQDPLLHSHNVTEGGHNGRKERGG